MERFLITLGACVLSNSSFFWDLILQTADRKLDAPDILDDFYLNLLDWGCNNVLAIALNDQVHLWNASNDSASKLVTVNHEDGPITSVSWAPDGRHIAIGLNNSHVQLWDCQVRRKVCPIFLIVCPLCCGY